MITLPTQVLVATRPVDMRRGHDSLAALACEYTERHVLAGALFVFFKRRSRRDAWGHMDPTWTHRNH